VSIGERSELTPAGQGVLTTLSLLCYVATLSSSSTVSQQDPSRVSTRRLIRPRTQAASFSCDAFPYASPRWNFNPVVRWMAPFGFLKSNNNRVESDPDRYETGARYSFVAIVRLFQSLGRR
jgi:hypothetical protein